MAGIEGPVVLAGLLILGLIVGLLLRFLLTLIVVVTVVAVLGIWVLGLVDPASLSQLPTIVEQYFDGRSISGEVFFTLGGLAFLGGVLLGVLLTSPLRGVEHPRPMA